MADNDSRDTGAVPAPSASAGGGSTRPPQAWGAPLLKFDHLWTRFETGLAAVVLALEILALSLWVVLKGMSTPAESESVAGVVFRAIIGAFVLGLIPFLALKKKGEVWQRWGAILGVTAGLFLAKAWVGVGVQYTSNLLNWYQQASTLTLFGGLRGIGTRLTLLLALLGGSLATGKGKHITIDLITRVIKPKLRLPVVVVGWLGAAVICFSGAWGFFDHIAIESFGAKPASSVGEKIEKVGEELGEGFFMVRKQLALDLKSTPHIVFRGEVYSDWLKGTEWNQWLLDAGFIERYGEEASVALRIPDEDVRSPMIVIPGRGEPRGRLVDTANLVFPIGLFIIAMRFVLRSLLAISGQVSVDPDDEDEFATDAAAAPQGGAQS